MDSDVGALLDRKLFLQWARVYVEKAEEHFRIGRIIALWCAGGVAFNLTCLVTEGSPLFLLLTLASAIVTTVHCRHMDRTEHTAVDIQELRAGLARVEANHG